MSECFILGSWFLPGLSEVGGLLLGSSYLHLRRCLQSATVKKDGFCVDEAQEQNCKCSEDQNLGALHVCQGRLLMRPFCYQCVLYLTFPNTQGGRRVRTEGK